MATDTRRFTIRKYEGDHEYAWAVFRKADIKGIRGIVMAFQAWPVVSGCAKREAEYYRNQCETDPNMK